MNNQNKNTLEYFTKNAEAWVSDGYELAGYNYPTPYHRLRVLLSILKDLNNINEILDLGCGGGNISIEIAKCGFNVIGIDQSESMLEIAHEKLNSCDNNLSKNVKFINHDISKLNSFKSDCIVAFGVSGYFPSDDEIFRIAKNNLKSGGYLVVSFRNKLFNLCSISENTIKDANDKNFPNLVNQYNKCLNQSFDKQLVKKFLNELETILRGLIDNFDNLDMSDIKPSERKNLKYEGVCQPRQATPDNIQEIADKFGFKLVQYYGIHPHILNPAINKLFPPMIYNKLSDSLLTFEKDSVSLSWSSVFIGLFKLSK